VACAVPRSSGEAPRDAQGARDELDSADEPAVEPRPILVVARMISEKRKPAAGRQKSVGDPEHGSRRAAFWPGSWLRGRALLDTDPIHRLAIDNVAAILEI